MLKAQKELGRDSCPKGRHLSRMLLGTETQASDGAWEQRKPTAGTGPARLPSSASYPALAVQPHAFLFIYLANFFKEGGKKPRVLGLASVPHAATYHIHWTLGVKKFHLNSCSAQPSPWINPGVHA